MFRTRRCYPQRQWLAEKSPYKPHTIFVSVAKEMSIENMFKLCRLALSPFARISHHTFKQINCIYIYIYFSRSRLQRLCPTSTYSLFFQKRSPPFNPLFPPHKKMINENSAIFVPSPPNKVIQHNNPCCFFAPYLAPFLHGNQCIWSNTEVVIQQTSGL